MDYIISEEELIDLLDDNITNACQSPIDLAKAILQDLQPVELMADFVLSEDLRQAKYDIRKIVEDNWQNINGNNIKIYIVKVGK